MMQAPLVSIILPTFNGSRYLRKSIDSCLAQTFKDWELIIINDCSTDDTQTIAETYVRLDSRIKLINNAFNKKLPLSLNTGFEAASGRYFTWTSDDNFYAPVALEQMLKAFEQDNSIDLVYADYKLIDETDQVFGTRTFGNVNQSFISWLGAGACFLYKREVHFQNNGYNPGAFLIEDYDFFVRAFLRFKFHYLNTPDLYFYREHVASLTATQSAVINDISKIFLERNLPGLERKLAPQETVLLYRKLAVHYSVNKNNLGKYREYLSKIGSLSKRQAIITSCFVLFKKSIQVFTVGLGGVVHSLSQLLRSSPKQ